LCSPLILVRKNLNLSLPRIRLLFLSQFASKFLQEEAFSIEVDLKRREAGNPLEQTKIRPDSPLGAGDQ
jgi:hypothetical protein